MSQILQKLRDVDPNDSDAVKEVITAFFQNLPKHTELNCNIWLRVLEDVVTRFPRYCSQHRTTIENYLAHFLDSNNYYNVIEAAKCAHALQQIRPSQDKTATPKNCWREQMTVLCNTAHTLIEALFSKTVDIYKNSKTVKKKDASLLANTPLMQALSRILNAKKSQGANGDEKNTVLCTKLRNIFVFIQAMLVEVYPVAKPIQPQLILEVIVQALSVSSSVNTNVSEASIVKIQALRTLDALVSCLGPNLIPFSALVVRFVMQTLRWSSENYNEESRLVRCTAYRSLGRWLSTLHAHAPGGRGRAAEDELARLVLGDVTPAKKIVQLTMSNQHTKNLSKKARRKLANTMLQQSSIAGHMPGEKNKADVSEEQSDEVAIAALDCAEMFLTVCGIFLKPTTHKMFQERLVRECYSLSGYSVPRSVGLLRALDAARKNTPASVPPPTQYCVQLYSTLVNSRCDEIRKFCSQALLDIRLHLHCSPPSLNFALDAQPDKIKDKAKRKEISKKNRAALEALLGKDKMPPEIVDEESASASGEPSNKKPRLEDDVATRISISSESEASVVISDDSDDDIEEIVEQNELTKDPGTEMAENSENVYSSPKTVQTTIQNDKFVQIIIEPVEDKVASVNSSVTNEITDKIDSVTPEASNIHEAKTQVALNVSRDTIDGENSPSSMEIAYDLPNTDKKVTVLEKTDDENLPSTNDTDDIQITCGQVAQNSQELNTKDCVEVEDEVSTPETNGTGELNDAATNGEVQTENVPNDNIEVKIISTEVTVEDMMADFVDEVNEEPNLAV